MKELLRWARIEPETKEPGAWASDHAAAFKAKVAIEALSDGKTIAEIAQKHYINPHQETEWLLS